VRLSLLLGRLRAPCSYGNRAYHYDLGIDLDNLWQESKNVLQAVAVPRPPIRSTLAAAGGVMSGAALGAAAAGSTPPPKAATIFGSGGGRGVVSVVQDDFVDDFGLGDVYEKDKSRL